MRRVEEFPVALQSERVVDGQWHEQNDKVWTDEEKEEEEKGDAC